MSDSAPALTAKQRKALAFRERKKGGSGKPPPRTPDDLPEMDVLGDGEEDVDDGEASGSKDKAKKADKGKGKAVAVDGGKAKKNAGKGKAEEDDADGPVEDGEGKKAPGKSKKEIKQRFILFVGRIPYRTSSTAIAEHFETLTGTRPSVRLLTTKPTPATAHHRATPAKSRGIAFVEFPTSAALQLGLRAHKSELDGQAINVELTAGGGGAGGERKRKIEERNGRVETQREKRKEREGEEDGEEKQEGKNKKAKKGQVEVVYADGSAPAESDAANGDAQDESGKPKRVRVRKSQFAGKTGAGASAGDAGADPSVQPGWAARKEGKFATTIPALATGGRGRGGPGARGRGAARERGGRGGGGGRPVWQPTGSNAMSVG